jgi:hypothetical protein
MEGQVLLGLFIFGIGLFIGDYLVVKLNKIKFIKKVDILELNRNIDALCLRSLDNLDFTYKIQNTKWIDEKDAEEVIQGITLEIYDGMSVNFKEYCYTMITHTQLVRHINYNVIRYVVGKMALINLEKK